MLVPLEAGTVPADPFELAVFGSQIAKALIGLAIAYIAYRGYRRNRSRPMLAISIGFLLVLGVPFVFFVVFYTVPGVPEVAVALVMEASQLVGLFVILYALRMPS